MPESPKLKSLTAAQKSLIRWRGSADHPDVIRAALAVERQRLREQEAALAAQQRKVRKLERSA